MPAESRQIPMERQKIYFNANCMILGPPPVAPRKRLAALVVILPNVAGLLKAWPGLLNLTELVTLNASARISTRRPSPIENSLETASSHSQYPGPKTLFAPRFPKVPGAGCANAAAFSQGTHGAGAHDFPLLGASVFARTWFGRCVPVFPKTLPTGFARPVI